MADEPSDLDAADADGTSESLDAWLGERADELDVPREELLTRIVGSYRTAVEGDATPALREDAVDERVSEILDERTGATERRLREGLQEDLEEIRQAILRLKGGLDRAAPADHDHDASDRIDGLADDVGALEATVGSPGEPPAGSDGGRAATVAERLADLDEKVTRVAAAVVRLQESERRRDGDREAALAGLKRWAARAGVTSGDCEHCGRTVNLGLLTEPTCPHCGTELRDVTDSSGLLFGSPTLVGGPGDSEGTEADG